MKIIDSIEVWVAENRGKNRNGFELIVTNKKGCFTKIITKKEVNKLHEIGINIEEG